MSTPRGERDNNPGNLESGIAWEGLVGTDGPYCVFDTAEHGIRALARDLHTKIVKHGLNTLNKLIAVYAPPSENDTTAYVADLAERLNIGADDLIDLSQLPSLVIGIITHECGRCIYSNDLISQSVSDALT